MHLNACSHDVNNIHFSIERSIDFKINLMCGLKCLKNQDYRNAVRLLRDNPHLYIVKNDASFVTPVGNFKNDKNVLPFLEVFQLLKEIDGCTLLLIPNDDKGSCTTDMNMFCTKHDLLFKKIPNTPMYMIYRKIWEHKDFNELKYLTGCPRHINYLQRVHFRWPQKIKYRWSCFEPLLN
jgi:hypothetical protein